MLFDALIRNEKQGGSWNDPSVTMSGQWNDDVNTLSPRVVEIKVTHPENGRKDEKVRIASGI